MVQTGEPLVLASASRARRRLLADAGLEFRTQPARIDEGEIKRRFLTAGRSAPDCALALAEAKARQVAGGRRKTLVIGADQLLVCGDTWFDKPETLADARAQLEALCGRSHELVTAACVVRDQDRIWHRVTSAVLTMREFSTSFLEAYIAAEGTAILGSVGAYRLEGRGTQLFARIKGDYFAILGLPLLDLIGFLRDQGVLRS